MATIHPPVDRSFPVPLPRTRVALVLSLTVLAALILYYFVGIDEGMTSVFGKTLAIHEVGRRRPAFPWVPLPLVLPC